MGLSRARVIQIRELPYLETAIQHSILILAHGAAPARPRLAKRTLRALVTEPDWAKQLQGTR